MDKQNVVRQARTTSLWQPALAALAVALALIVAAVFAERIDRNSWLEKQREDAVVELEAMSSGATRDLTQKVAVVQGLSALVGANPNIDQQAFANYIRPFVRENPDLRRVFLVKNGKVARIEPYTENRAALDRIETHILASEPAIARAIEKGAPALVGPFALRDGEPGLLYTRPVFTEGAPGPGAKPAFVGLTVEAGPNIECKLGLCEPRPKYRMALKIFVDQQYRGMLRGDPSLFDAAAQPALGAIRFPGVRIEIAALPSDGWSHDSPNRWMIRGLAVLLSLFCGTVAFVWLRGAAGLPLGSRLWAFGASASVFLVLLGLATILDRLEVSRAAGASRDAMQKELALVTSRATRDVTEELSVSSNLSAFVSAHPDFSEVEFRQFAQRLRRANPDLMSIRLARGGKISHVEPADSIDPALIGHDLARSAADAAANQRAVETGTPVFSGPVNMPNGDQAFLYRRPVFLGDQRPSADNFWGFSTVLIDRKALVCHLGICADSQKYRFAMRLEQDGAPQPAFQGDQKLFDEGSDALVTAVRLPGAQIDIAAVPFEGWSGGADRRWLIWTLAIPFAFASAGGLLFVFARWPEASLRVLVGLAAVAGGNILAYLAPDIESLVRSTGLGVEKAVWPSIVAWIAFSCAYTFNSWLEGHVWKQVADAADPQRAPAILRSIVSFLIYGVALLWAGHFLFGLDLQGVGMTSGLVGIVVGFAVQKLILDFFAGVMIGMEKPFVLGDWIEISKGEIRGMVTEMTWRTTTIRTTSPDYVMVPNSVLAGATIVNRSRPASWSESTIIVSTFAGVPTALVRKALEEAIAAALPHIDNISRERAPRVDVYDSREGQIQYILRFYVHFGLKSDAPAKSALLAAIQAAFDAHGVEFAWGRTGRPEKQTPTLNSDGAMKPVGAFELG